MKVALHNQAIYLLLQELAPTKPEGILIDQFTLKITIGNMFVMKKSSH